MLSPEVAHFPPPKHHLGRVITSPTSGKAGQDRWKEILEHYPFTTQLTLTFLGKLHCPTEIREVLDRDSESFFVAQQLPLHLILSKEFLNSELTVVTNCITDPIHVFLSLEGVLQIVDRVGDLAVTSSFALGLSSGVGRVYKAIDEDTSVLAIDLRLLSENPQSLKRWREAFKTLSKHRLNVRFKGDAKVVAKVSKLLQDAGVSVSDKRITEERVIRRPGNHRVPVFTVDKVDHRIVNEYGNFMGALMLDIDPDLVRQTDEFMSVEDFVAIQYDGIFLPDTLKKISSFMMKMPTKDGWSSMMVSSSFAIPDIELLSGQTERKRRNVLSKVNLITLFCDKKQIWNFFTRSFVNS